MMRRRSPAFLVHSFSEGVLIGLEQLRTNKLRSALTVLGVVIGVATVMAMASIVHGIRQQIFNAYKRRDAQTVGRLCREHCAATGERLIERLTKEAQ